MTYDFSTIKDNDKRRSIINEILEYVPLQLGEDVNYKGIRIAPLKYKNDSAMFIKSFMDAIMHLNSSETLNTTNVILTFEAMKESIGESMVENLNLSNFNIVDVLQGSESFEDMYSKIENWYTNNVDSLRSTASVFKTVSTQLMEGNKFNTLNLQYEVTVHDRGLNKLPLGQYNKLNDVFTKDELNTVRYVSNLSKSGITELDFRRKDGSTYTFNSSKPLTQGFYIMIEDTISGEPIITKLDNIKVGENEKVKERIKSALTTLLGSTDSYDVDVLIEAQNKFAKEVSPYLIRTLSKQENKLGFTTYTSSSKTNKGDKGTMIHFTSTASNVNANSWGVGRVDKERHEFSIRNVNGKYIITKIDRNGSSVTYRDLAVFDSIMKLYDSKQFNQILDNIEIHPDAQVFDGDTPKTEEDIIKGYIKADLIKTNIQPIVTETGKRITLNNVNPYQPNSAMLDFSIDTSKPYINNTKVSTPTSVPTPDSTPTPKEPVNLDTPVDDSNVQDNTDNGNQNGIGLTRLKQGTRFDRLRNIGNSSFTYIGESNIVTKFKELAESKSKMTVRELINHLYGDISHLSPLFNKLNDDLLDTEVRFGTGYQNRRELALTVAGFDKTKDGALHEQFITFTDNFIEMLNINNNESFSNKLFDVILTHELIHAGLNKQGMDSKRNELTDIQKYLLDNVTELYSIIGDYNIDKSELNAVLYAKNASELITYGLTDARFTALFNEIASPRNNNKSIWSVLSNIIMDILKITNVNDKSILVDIVSVAMDSNIIKDFKSPVGEETTYPPAVNTSTLPNDTKSPVEEQSKKTIANKDDKVKPNVEQLTINFGETTEEESKPAKEDTTSESTTELGFNQTTDYTEDELDFAVYAESSIVC
jgi:hypothetical protein